MSVKCGTDHGWHRHRDLGQDPCHVCDVAHKEAVATWTKTRLEAADAPSRDRRRPTTVTPVEIPLDERQPWERDPAKCGTAAGYLRHKHLRTDACRRCQDAWDTFSAGSPDQPARSGRHHTNTFADKS